MNKILYIILDDTSRVKLVKGDNIILDLVYSSSEILKVIKDYIELLELDKIIVVFKTLSSKTSNISGALIVDNHYSSIEDYNNIIRVYEESNTTLPLFVTSLFSGIEDGIYISAYINKSIVSCKRDGIIESVECNLINLDNYSAKISEITGKKEVKDIEENNLDYLKTLTLREVQKSTKFNTTTTTAAAALPPTDPDGKNIKVSEITNLDVNDLFAENNDKKPNNRFDKLNILSVISSVLMVLLLVCIIITTFRVNTLTNFNNLRLKSEMLDEIIEINEEVNQELGKFIDSTRNTEIKVIMSSISDSTKYKAISLEYKSPDLSVIFDITGNKDSNDFIKQLNSIREMTYFEQYIVVDEKGDEKLMFRAGFNLSELDVNHTE